MGCTGSDEARGLSPVTTPLESPCLPRFARVLLLLPSCCISSSHNSCEVSGLSSRVGTQRRIVPYNPSPPVLQPLLVRLDEVAPASASKLSLLLATVGLVPGEVERQGGKSAKGSDAEVKAQWRQRSEALAPLVEATGEGLSDYDLEQLSNAIMGLSLMGMQLPGSWLEQFIEVGVLGFRMNDGGSGGEESSPVTGSQSFEVGGEVLVWLGGRGIQTDTEGCCAAFFAMWNPVGLWCSPVDWTGWSCRITSIHN